MKRLGVIGLGLAGQAFLPAIDSHPEFTLAAVCDPRADACQEFGNPRGARVFSDVGAMIANGGLDAVYIGTPTELHIEHVMQALDAGLHVLVEKPMAASVADCVRIADKARGCNCALVVGHSHSHDLPIRSMRDVIASGRIGAPRIINTSCYTDWVYRPRRPEELDPALGGGVTFRQGAHQFDILCVLAGAPAVSLRASTFDFDPARPTIGAHVVMLTFANGVVGTAVYNGYGYFHGAELIGDVGEWGQPFDPAKAMRRKPLAVSADNELAQKQARARGAIAEAPPFQPHFGLTLVSCTGGDLRQSPRGLYLYSVDGKEELLLPNDRSPRELVLDEFADAIAGKPVFHNADHGLAVTEICDAVLLSSVEGREITLVHQHRGKKA